MTDLPLGLLSVSGDDAATFLHGQLTNQIAELKPGDATFAAYCSPKGRILGLFWIIRGADRFRMLTDRALLPSLRKRLQMFVLRSKVEIVDESDTLTLFAGASLSDANDKAPTVEHSDDHILLRLPFGGPVLGISPEQAPDGYSMNAAQWRSTMIAAGLPWISEATAEAFVPQMVNLDLLGGLNFRKGCYPGQEIVARTHYRGILKRRMWRFSCDYDVADGDDVRDAEGKLQGQVVLSEGGECLAVAQIAAMTEATPLFANESALERLTLPYAVPEEQGA